MSVRVQLWLIFLAPVVLLAALFAFGLTIPVPHLGRDYVVRIALPEAGAPLDLPTIYGPDDRTRPLVVIDPGHGGKDPGASGFGLQEKDVVLGLAMALRDRLVEEGGVRVALTREDDRFLVLSERPEIARRMGADLFISIHADSAGEVEGVRGASIYTLSERASSEAAARFADRENAADRVNGVDIGDQSGAVGTILIELAQRRVQQTSGQFSGIVVREGADALDFHPQARRSAALAVLRAPDVPAILFESGFITNQAEARRLTSEQGKADFAEAMARSIRIFLARQRAQ
jgi:N-acetylmuramoyl-L-alanine amidase